MKRIVGAPQRGLSLVVYEYLGHFYLNQIAMVENYKSVNIYTIQWILGCMVPFWVETIT